MDKVSKLLLTGHTWLFCCPHWTKSLFSYQTLDVNREIETEFLKALSISWQINCCERAVMRLINMVVPVWCILIFLQKIDELYLTFLIKETQLHCLCIMSLSRAKCCILILWECSRKPAPSQLCLHGPFVGRNSITSLPASSPPPTYYSEVCQPLCGW